MISEIRVNLSWFMSMSARFAEGSNVVVLDPDPLLKAAIRRVALMLGERSHAIRFHLEPNQLVISSQNAEEGEASETVQTDYNGEETDIGFNAQYLQDFLNVIGDGAVAFEFKDGNSQAQLRPADGGEYDYKYVVMPMRI